MSTIDTAALDEAVRRFPSMIALYRETGRLEPPMLDAVIHEYRLVLAERCKGRVV